MTSLLVDEPPQTEIIHVARRGARFVAKLIDFGLVAVFALVGQISELLFGPRAPLSVALTAILSLAFWAVSIWLLAIRGQSPGKIVMKVAIVDPDSAFPPGYLRAAVIREGPLIVLSVVNPFSSFVYLLVDSVFIFGPSRRCLHDRLARTKLIGVGRDWP